MLDETPGATLDAVLNRLNDALERGDAKAAAALFQADSYWRDLVAFTWNLRTMEGPDQIRDMLAHQLPKLRVAGSNPVARSIFLIFSNGFPAALHQPPGQVANDLDGCSRNPPTIHPQRLWHGANRPANTVGAPDGAAQDLGGTTAPTGPAFRPPTRPSRGRATLRGMYHRDANPDLTDCARRPLAGREA